MSFNTIRAYQLADAESGRNALYIREHAMRLKAAAKEFQISMDLARSTNDFSNVEEAHILFIRTVESYADSISHFASKIK
jgi:branched-subunit amino acid aminotransferase/4-amino-4-deoxychorismate lyase